MIVTDAEPASPRPSTRDPGHARALTALVIATSETLAATIESALRRDSRLRVVVGDPARLVSLIDDHNPAVVVLAAPPDRLAQVLKSLAGRVSAPALLIVTADPRAAWTSEARKAGVRAVLRSDATASELSAAITAIAAGLLALHPDAVRAERAPASVATDDVTPLTAREVEILEMMADGMTNRAIARRLGITAHTVKFHVASIFVKVGARSRAQAVTVGVRRGLISL